VLRCVADTMRKVARRYDSVGRYGGEEFLIILPGCDEANAASHAERLRGAVGELQLETPLGPVRPTISLGVAVTNAQSPTVGDILVQTADAALYCAKRNGRNRVQFGNSIEHLAEV
jgi:diguanylate cyclase (GGDEF)-like protein